MRKKIVAVVTITVLAVALFLYLRSGHRDAGMAPIRLSGTVEVDTVQASFRLPGRLSQRLVEEGEVVRVGQLLARLEDQDHARESELRRAEMEAAKAALDELEAGSRREEIGQAEAAVAAAEAEAQRLADDCLRLEALFRREVIPRRDLDAARSARDASQAQVRKAREALALVRIGPRRERIEQARARYRAAEQAYALARNRRDYTVLYSPIAGTVLAKHAEAGEQVGAGSPIVTLGNLADTWVRAFLSETDLGRVKLGQKVRISGDTWPGKVYEGTVSFISPEAEFTPKNVRTEKERVKLVYRIKIAVANHDLELKPGMPVDAEL